MKCIQTKSERPIVAAVTKATLDATGYIDYCESYLKETPANLYYEMVNDWRFKLPNSSPWGKINHLREI